MNEHPDTEECPVFAFRIMTKFKDCLSRQVAEAITINYTEDHILNSKNEYMANCLTRLVISEDKFDRLKKAKKGEMDEKEELRKLEQFKLREAFKRKKRK